MSESPGQRNIGQWQRDFYAAPVIWMTFYRNEDGAEELGDVYESEEAAKLELQFADKRGGKGRRLPIIRKVHIHSLELSRERWERRPLTPPASGRTSERPL